MSQALSTESQAGRRSGAALRTWVSKRVRWIQLNRPDKGNALTADMMLDAADVVGTASADPEVRAIGISAAGRIFSAGADLDTRDDPAREPSPVTLDAANVLVGEIVKSPKVVVAAVQGPAVGVGVSIVLSADLALMRSDAYLSLAFSKIGLMPDGGATALLASITGRSVALRIALLDQPISAREAESQGLVAAVHDEASFDDAVAGTLAAIANGPSRAFAYAKHAINSATLAELNAAFARERAGQLSLLASADFAEGVAAFLAKRAPQFRGV